MAKKTNKTSHVMNLLTNGASPEAENNAEPTAQESASPENPAAGQEKKGDVQSHTVTPKKVTVVDEGSRNDRLSQEILNNLSEELEKEEQSMENHTPEAIPENHTEAQTEQAQAAPVQTETEPAQAVSDAVQTEPEAAETVPDAPAEPQAEPAPAAESVPEESSAPAAPAETPAAQPTSEPAAEPEQEEQPIQLSGKTAHHAILPPGHIEGNLINGEYRFVNIMEHLMLRQDISSYLDQYNVCKCPRCMADVCALTLTALPPKYVVTSKDSLSPLLSYYESRNKITMLTALIKACNKVRENPRHKRPQ